MMYQTNGYNRYREQNVMTAGPGGLILMLYDGCIKELKLAKLAREDKNKTESAAHLIKAQRIIDELISSLNFEIEMSKQLYSLYDFMNYELIQANVEQDYAHVDTVLTMLQDLRETWVQVIQQSRQGMDSPIQAAASR